MPESLQLHASGDRIVEAQVAGPPGAPLVVYLHGTPQAHDLPPELLTAAQDAGLRLASIARPGYAGSTRQPGRLVADVVADVLLLMDTLAAPRAVVVGVSGGGPHALACGALAGERCVAVACVAGVGPFDGAGLDAMAGMGEENLLEYAAALQGEAPLRELLEVAGPPMVAGGPDGILEGMAGLLPPADRAVFTGEVAAHVHASMALALRDGIDGWLDDDLAFVRSWGFTPAQVQVPVFLWQGDQDLMVPPAHARWMAQVLPSATLRALPDDGHLTLLIQRSPEILADLTAVLA